MASLREACRRGVPLVLLALASPLPLERLGAFWFLGLPTVPTLFCLGLDARHDHRMHRVSLVGAVLLIAPYVVRLAFTTTDAWMNMAGWLVSFV